MASVRFTLSGLPASCGKAYVRVASPYEALALSGELTGSQKSVVPLTRSAEGRWVSNEAFLFPTTGTQTNFTIAYEDDNEEQYAQVTYQAPLRAGVPYELNGTLSGGTLEVGGGGTGREVGEGGLQGVGRDVATGHRAGEVGGVGRKLGCVGGDDAIDGRGGGDGIGGLVGGDGYHTGLHALGYRQADLLVGGRDGLAGAQGAVIGEGIEAQRVEVVGGGGGAGEDADGGGLAVGRGFVDHLDFLAGGEGQGEGCQTQEGMNGVALHRLVYLG